MIFFLSFLLSILLEFSVFFIFFYFFRKYRSYNFYFNLFMMVFLVNILTQIPFTFIIPFLNFPYLYHLVVSEFFIFLIEAFVICYIFLKKDYIYMFFISLFANLISWQFTYLIIIFLRGFL
jgi:hypothetical protein